MKKQKTNKFWYSQGQKEVSMDYDDDKKCVYVETKYGWREYTEWCSSGNNSNWEDAVLVFETKDTPNIKIEQ